MTGDPALCDPARGDERPWFLSQQIEPRSVPCPGAPSGARPEVLGPFRWGRGARQFLGRGTLFSRGQYRFPLLAAYTRPIIAGELCHE